MIAEFNWIEDTIEGDAVIKECTTKSINFFYIERDPKVWYGRKKRWWSVRIEELWVAEFTTKGRITKADKELALSLCLARYGGGCEEL